MPSTRAYVLSKREKHLFYNAKARAKKRGLEFSIKFEDLEFPSHCPVLGIPLKFGDGGKGQRNDSPSIDRIDPSKGYIKGNVSVISGKANTCKSNLTLEQVQSLVEYMSNETESQEEESYSESFAY